MEINAIKELQGALEERGLKLSQAETKEVLKALEDTIDSIYDQMEVDDSVSLGLFLIDKINRVKTVSSSTKLKEEPIGVLGSSWSNYSTEITKYNSAFKVGDKVTVKVRLKKSVKKRIEK